MKRLIYNRDARKWQIVDASFPPNHSLHVVAEYESHREQAALDYLASLKAATSSP
jgi:hypothetical protein